jgi:hypothetical protein
MKSPFRRMYAIAACLAAWTLVSPAQAQVIITPVPIDINNPSCQDAAAICTIQTLVHELEITDVKTVARLKCDEDGVCTKEDFDPELGVNFTVTWFVDPITGEVTVDDLTDKIFVQQADVPGYEAVIGEGKNGSNVYCGTNLGNVKGIFAPVDVTPTKITFCWARGPCLLSPAEVLDACFAYNGVPAGPPADDDALNKLLQLAHYLQEHLVAPEQPINVCGCPFFDDVKSEVIQRVAEFCDPSVPEAEGGCPIGLGLLTGLATQAAVTIGPATCQRVVIGGRAFFIGDTCE